MDEHAQETRPALCDERLNAGGAGLPDRGNDAAARGENIEIQHAGHFQFELVRPVARPNEMRMRINKAWHEDAAARIERGLIGVSCFEFGG